MRVQITLSFSDFISLWYISIYSVYSIRKLCSLEIYIIIKILLKKILIIASFNQANRTCIGRGSKQKPQITRTLNKVIKQYGHQLYECSGITKTTETRRAKAMESP